MPLPLPNDEELDLTDADVDAAEPPLAVDEWPDPFIDVEWPERFFLTDDAGGLAGPLLAEELSQDPDTGAYFWSRDALRPLFFRVVWAADDVSEIHCVDGGGRLWRYRISTE